MPRFELDGPELLEITEGMTSAGADLLRDHAQDCLEGFMNPRTLAEEIFRAMIRASTAKP